MVGSGDGWEVGKYREGKKEPRNLECTVATSEHLQTFTNSARRPGEMPPKAKPKPKPKQTPKAPYPGFKPEDKKRQNGPGHNEVKKAVVNGVAPGDC